VVALTRKYERAPVLITSRVIGYREAPLPGDLFTALTIPDFGIAQVRDYSKRWFRIAGYGSPAERRGASGAFVRASESAADLRSNPLLLGLMCALFRGERTLPQRRAELYQQCARLYFDRWDRRRGITPVTGLSAYVLPAMQHLAHWMYSDPALSQGVTTSELEAEAARFFAAEAYSDAHLAQEASERLVDFCTGRGWLLEDAGSTIQEHLYRFHHQTFLEYFTAEYLVGRYETADSLAQAVVARVLEGQWEAVGELAFGIRTSRDRRSGDRLLSQVTQHFHDPGRRGRRAVLFGSRLLRVLTVHEEVLAAYMRSLIAHFASTLDVRQPDSGVGETLATAVDHILIATEETRAPLANSFLIVVDEALDGADRFRRVAMEMLLLVQTRLVSGEDDLALHAIWGPGMSSVLRAKRVQLAKTAACHPDLGALAYRLGVTPLASYVASNGVEALFRPVRLVSSGQRLVAPAQHLFGWVVHGAHDDIEEPLRAELAGLAPILRTHADELRALDGALEVPRRQRRLRPTGVPFVEGDALFAYLVMCLIGLRSHSGLGSSALPFGDALAWLFNPDRNEVGPWPAIMGAGVSREDVDILVSLARP
jgi:hypothetical protein